MVDKFQIDTEPFNNDRFISVYTPVSYSENTKRYPVLYMHDGQNVFRDEDAIGGTSLGLEEYLDVRKMEVIVVAIDQNSAERKNEYCPWVNGDYSQKFLAEGSEPFGGAGKRYIQFVAEEIKPLIDKKYRTLENQTAMAGISMGGLISVYAACLYPQIFRDIRIFSSAFYANQEELENLIETADLSGITSFYMDCGTDEAGQGTIISQAFLQSNQAVYDGLKRKIPNAEFSVLEGNEHHYRYFKKRVPELFSFLKG